MQLLRHDTRSLTVCCCTNIWVPQVRRVFVFAPSLGYHEPQPEKNHTVRDLYCRRAHRPYFFSACFSSCWGNAITVWPSMPVMVFAPTIAFTIASSVASTVAVNKGLMRSFETVCTVLGPGAASACGFAVEQARQISPELLPETDPVRASPSEARRAIRFS